MRTTIIISMALIFVACSKNEKTADAYGNFEAKEIIISAETQGKILSLKIDEGDKIKESTTAAIIDTMQLHFSLNQLLASYNSIDKKIASTYAQKQIIVAKQESLQSEKLRFEKLVESKAVPKKQFDDIENQLKIVEQELKSFSSQISVIESEKKVLKSKIEQTNDMISRATILNPKDGTVLKIFTEENEIAAPGKAIYKLGLLDDMLLKVYVSGTQLSEIKLGQKVKVYIDKSENSEYEFDGIISWISSEAEFTPKIIQTKEERVNLVYGVKITVKNNGQLKIGMPAEVKF